MGALLLVASQTLVAQTQDLPAVSGFNQPERQNMDPCLSFDGRQMAYVWVQETSHQLLLSRLGASGQWEQPAAVPAFSAFEAKEKALGGPCFSGDGKTLYFHATVNGNSDLFFSVNQAGTWSAPQALPAPINTAGDERWPSVSADGRSIFFVRGLPEDACENKDYPCGNIYQCAKGADGQWKEPMPLPEPVNLMVESSPKISADGSTLYYSSVREGGLGGYDLYMVKMLAPQVWSLPSPLPFNTEDDDFSASAAVNRGQMLWTTGELDKRKSTISLQLSPVPPGAAPEAVMRVSGRMSRSGGQALAGGTVAVKDPFSLEILSEWPALPDGSYALMAPKGREYVLDFTAPGHSHHFESLDLSQLQKDAEKTLDPKLFDKVSLVLNVFDKQVFQPLESRVQARTAGQAAGIAARSLGQGRYALELPIGKRWEIVVEKDFFQASGLALDLDKVVIFEQFEKDIELEQKLAPMVFQLLDQQSRAAVRTNISLNNLSRRESLVVTPAQLVGQEYRVMLREGDQYEFSLTPEGYEFKDGAFDMPVGGNNLLIELMPLSKGAKLVLDNINFETNSADLTLSSYASLNRATELILRNPKLKIEIAAHTDDVGSDAYNLKLSERRAASVMAYFRSQGVPDGQLVAKGYGETEPTVPNTDDLSRATNRRVELKVTESGF